MPPRRWATCAGDGRPPPPDKLVVLRFESREAARAWRNSPEYLAILPIREATSTSRVYIVDAYDG